MATQIQTVVMGWQVYLITHDPLSLGLVGLSEALPFLGLSLIGGWAADRHDRRMQTLLAILTMLLGGVLLLAVNLHGAPTRAWVFYAIQVLSGLGRAFYRPAFQALGTELVPREAFQNAATWRGSTFEIAMVAGPSLGGLLCGFGSAGLAYAVECLFMVFAVAALYQVAPRPRTPSSTTILKSLGEGVAFVFSHRLVLSALTLDLFAVLFGGAVALLPIFAADILHAGAQGLGVLRTAQSLGAVTMGFWLAHHPPTRRAGKVLLLCVAGFGLCWIGFALSTTLWLSLAILAFSGAMDNVSVVLRGTLVQTLTPMDMMGRVQAVNAFFIGSSNELGGFESGLTARLLGVVPSVVLGGLATLGVVGVTAWRVPELRRMKRITG